MAKWMELFSSLIFCVGKLYGRIVINKVVEVTQDKLWDVVCGFMSGRGCTDQIFSLQQIVEKSLNVNKVVFSAFIDLEKAYDKVNREKLWEVLYEYGVPSILIKAIRSFYIGSEACVRVNGTCSTYFDISLGLRQGCTMSPWLFNIFMDKCVRKACDIDIGGIRVGNLDVKVLLYADDAVILAGNGQELQTMLTNLHRETDIMEFKINVGKTKVCVFNREGNPSGTSFVLGGEVLEEVKEFIYLGRLFESSGKIGKEVDRRTAAGRRIIGGVNAVIRSSVVSKEAKVAIYKSVLVPTVLYGSECWVLQDSHRSKINAVGMDYLRGVCGYRRIDKVRNDRVLVECNVKGLLTKQAERGCLRWFGHIERMPDLRVTKQIYEGTIEGRRNRGRPAKTWEVNVDEILGRNSVRSTRNRRECMTGTMSLEEAKEVCQDRKKWQEICRSIA